MKDSLIRLALIPVLFLLAQMAGLFFVFSNTVMPGLDDSAAQAAVAAMQGINRAVRNPVFFTSYLLTPLAPVIATVILFIAGQKRSALFLALASVIYIVGVLWPTAATNIPMNDALASLGTPKADANVARIWADFSGPWTSWNTVRAWACTVSFAFAGAGFLGLRRAT